eukprot:Gb_24954 [translate_table: standard]
MYGKVLATYITPSSAHPCLNALRHTSFGRKTPPNPSTKSTFTTLRAPDIDQWAYTRDHTWKIGADGRLLGFVSSLGAEFVSGQDLQSQRSSGGVSWFVLSAVLLSFASLIPMFKDVSTESKFQAIMSSRAEMWNGRFAMLGLMALAITECRNLSRRQIASHRRLWMTPTLLESSTAVDDWLSVAWIECSSLNTFEILCKWSQFTIVYKQRYFVRP